MAWVEAEAVEWDRWGSVGYLAEWLGIYGGWADREAPQSEGWRREREARGVGMQMLSLQIMVTPPSHLRVNAVE